MQKSRKFVHAFAAAIERTWPRWRERLQGRLPLFASGLILLLGGWVLTRALYVESPPTQLTSDQSPEPSTAPQKLPSFIESPVPATAITNSGDKDKTAEPAPANEESKTVQTEQGETESPIMLSRFTVLAIDAGHGGIDPGSIGRNGLTEKEVTLRLAKKVRSLLSSVDNLHVALTRYDDRTININTRTEIIKEIGADFVLSLHMNAIPQEQITLVESYYKTSRRAHMLRDDFFIKSSDSNIEISRSLATTIQDAVFKTVKRHNEISVNAGLKTDPMRILSQNEVPGALLEVTCLSNPEEEERLRSDEYLDKLAYAIANGIKQFLKTNLDAMTVSTLTPFTASTYAD
ncbi:MAG: N-acetylmuramoyl-L-alanine amidase [Gammaproteobacteria bacterium]|nr:N-acetylmuramoyl-L-alanine amidase [Gammaproteobacteria bacterium]